MKDIIFYPKHDTNQLLVIETLVEELNKHNTTHVMGVEINELITLLKQGNSFKYAVEWLRVNSSNISKRYINEILTI